MSIFLAIISLGLLIALAVFFFINKKLARLVAQSQAEIVRVRNETEKAVTEAQTLMDRQVADMRTEAERVHQHYEAEARKVTDAAQAQLAIAQADADHLRKYAPIGDAEGQMRQVLTEAMKEATALREQAQTLLDQARVASEDERLRAKEKAREVYEQADARLKQATHDAGRIVADAENRAKEVAGDAYDALRDKQLLEHAAEAMRNVVEGYGDRYIIPTHSMLDDLAVEFGYTSAGESLKSARAQSRRMVEQGPQPASTSRLAAEEPPYALSSTLLMAASMPSSAG